MGLVPLLFTQGPVALGTQIILQLADDTDKMSQERQTIYLATLARVRGTLGEKEACFQTITQARAVSEHVVNPIYRALVLDAEIRMFSSLGQTEKAADSVREALAHLKTHPMPAYEAKVHSAIGNLYYNIGRIDDALEAYESSGNGFAALNAVLCCSLIGQCGNDSSSSSALRESRSSFYRLFAPTCGSSKR